MARHGGKWRGCKCPSHHDFARAGGCMSLVLRVGDRWLSRARAVSFQPSATSFQQLLIFPHSRPSKSSFLWLVWIHKHPTLTHAFQLSTTYWTLLSRQDTIRQPPIRHAWTIHRRQERRFGADVFWTPQLSTRLVAVRMHASLASLYPSATRCLVRTRCEPVASGCIGCWRECR